MNYIRWRLRYIKWNKHNEPCRWHFQWFLSSVYYFYKLFLFLFLSYTGCLSCFCLFLLFLFFFIFFAKLANYSVLFSFMPNIYRYPSLQFLQKKKFMWYTIDTNGYVILRVNFFRMPYKMSRNFFLHLPITIFLQIMFIKFWKTTRLSLSHIFRDTFLLSSHVVSLLSFSISLFGFISFILPIYIYIYI